MIAARETGCRPSFAGTRKLRDGSGGVLVGSQEAGSRSEPQAVGTASYWCLWISGSCLTKY